jgi:hypothetical protein
MKKLFSIVLAFMLLASHMSLVIGTHYCGGRAIESKLVFGALDLSCSMAEMEQTCNDSEAPGTEMFCLENVPCCENEYQVVQFTDNFVKDVAMLFFNDYVAAIFFYTTPKLGKTVKVEHLSTVFTPPPVKKNVQVLFQTFLI